MGSLYVSQYAAHGCTDISSSAYRVLLRMALAVYDEDSSLGANDEGLYYGGWKGLTAVLGYGTPMDDEPISANAKRAISRALGELRKHGYITVAERKYQRQHWNKAYRLNLTGWSLDRQTRR